MTGAASSPLAVPTAGRFRAVRLRHEQRGAGAARGAQCAAGTRRGNTLVAAASDITSKRIALGDW